MENLNNNTTVGENAEIVKSDEQQISELTAKIASDPENTELFAELAKLYFKSKDYENAAVYYEKSGAMDIDALQCLIVTGKSGIIIDNAKNNAETLKKTISSLTFMAIFYKHSGSKDFIEIFDSLGGILPFDDFKFFIEQFYESIENRINTLSFDEVFNFATMYNNLDLDDKALEIVKKAVTNDFQLENKRKLFICKIYITQGKENEAEQVLLSLIEPLSHENLKTKAEIYQDMKQYNLALDIYNSININDLSEEEQQIFQIWQSSLLAEMFSNGEISTDDFNLYVNEKNKKILGLNLLSTGKFRYMRNKYENTISNITKAIELIPEETDCYLMRANCYIVLNQYHNAIADFSKVIEINPEINTYGVRGLYYYYTNQFKNAIKDYTKAIDKNPENIMNFLLRALAYVQLERQDECFSDLAYCKNNWHLWLQKKESEKETLIKYNKYDEKAYLKEYSISPSNFLGPIISKCDFKFMLRLMELFFDLKNHSFYTVDYAKLAIILDDLPEKQNTLPESYRQICIKLFDTKDFSSDEDYYLNSSLEMFKLTRKMFLISIITNNITIENYTKEFSQDQYRLLLDMFNLFSGISAEISKQVVELQKQHEQSILEARLAERNEIIARLSHSIKNLIRSAVIDPLTYMQQTHTLNEKNLTEALKGANLIREIANGMNLSFKGSLADFEFDAANTGFEPHALSAMFTDSLKYAVSNMLDGKYFNVFMRQYFGGRESYDAALTEWNRIGAAATTAELIDYINRHLTAFELSITAADNLVIGNEKGSAIKLLIMFQEIIFNAIKYTAFVPKSERHIVIRLTAENGIINFFVNNSCNPEVQAKSSGLGSVIIDNFAKLLAGELKIDKSSNWFNLSLTFPDLWHKTDK